MGHYCGAPNTTVDGYCERWLVNYVHCHSHRSGHISPPPPPPPPPPPEPDVAALWADIIVDGLDGALSKLVVDYVGKVEQQRLRIRSWKPASCQALADAAQAILDLGKASHEATGRAVGALLPRGTPRFVRRLTGKVAEKIPLPWDAKLKAVARGLQVIGIFTCMVQGLPPSRCACLLMIGKAVSEEVLKEKVANLIHQARDDMAGEVPEAA